MDTAAHDAIKQLRVRHDEKRAGIYVPDTQEAIENRAIIRSATFKVKEKIYTNLLHERTKQQMIEGDFSLFGTISEEVSELFNATQKVTFSKSGRNATAVLVTINPPKDINPDLFKASIEKFISKISKIEYHGCYYFEQRTESEDISEIGLHVHIAINEGDFACELRKRFVQILMGKSYLIFSQNPSPNQVHCKFAKTPNAYLKMLDYANHPKKRNSDNSDISDFIRTYYQVDPIIEF